MRLSVSRSATGVVFAGMTAVALVAGSAPASAGKKLVFMSWGGTWMDYAKTAFIQPFEKETGVKVECRTHQNTMDGRASACTNHEKFD